MQTLPLPDCNNLTLKAVSLVCLGRGEPWLPEEGSEVPGPDCMLPHREKKKNRNNKIPNHRDRVAVT
jgi:hypothetical protein